MAKSNSSQTKPAPPTSITLTLPESEDDIRSGTLLIARGELAHVRQFTYANLSDLPEVIKDAMLALAAVEAEPPVIAETPIALRAPKPSTKPEAPDEPTIDVPLKKGIKTVKISHLKITGGETDAAAYKQATLLAGKLIDGRLWDGESPIHFTDVYATANKMKYLTERDLSLFTLEDFVQLDERESLAEIPTDNEPLTLQTPDADPVSESEAEEDKQPILL